jgi:hypothetical protein
MILFWSYYQPLLSLSLLLLLQLLTVLRET